ncbi:MAG TPA: autotransporter outer membrane beta-barrel domain-containing protein, partial [Candidatus Helicobacter avistercoris]|nr:autotransporter outer membrane beta-barrel domain-containing protein [Candidatus Helicobacter avistercoris]
KIFKPLVASSLALALGASVAVAQDPTFTYTDSKSGSETIKDISLTDVQDCTQTCGTTKTNLRWDNTSDYLLLKTDSNTTVNGIELNFNRASALYQTAGFVTQINISQNTVTNVTFTNDSGKGLKLGDDGTGTFKVQLADTFANITKPTINLNFNSTTDNIALYGNLEISGGASSDLSTIINFGGDLKGNLSITKYYEHVSKNNEITFNNSGKLDGNLLNDGGNLTLKFMENGGITGNITSYGTSIIKVENGTLKLGDSSNKNISIISGGGMQATNTLTASKIEAHIEKLEVQGNSNSNNDNTITADEGTIQITTLSATSTAGNASNHNQNNITLSNGTLTIGSITADNYNKNNITLGGTGTITGNITQNGNSQNNFTLLGNSSTLILQGSNNAITSLTSSGGTLQLDSGSSGITLTAKTLDGVLAVSFKGNQTGNLTIEGGTHTLSNISFESSSKGNLKLQNTHTTIASSVNATTNNTLDLTLTNSTLNLNGGEIASVTSSGSASNNIINFNSGTTTIKGFSASSTNNGLSLNLDGGNLSLKSITADGTTSGSNNSASVNVTVGNNSTLLLDGANKINSLSGNGGIIDFVGTASGASSKTFSARSTLTTKTFSGDLNAIVYASKTSADQIIVTDTNSNSSGTLTILAQGDIHEILSITQADEVVVAQVKDSGVKVQGGESVIDGMVLDLSVVQKDGSGSGGNGTTTEYIIGKSVNKGIENSIQEVTNTALTVNYDLFLANFNSLNKRMGELRDNPYSQGVWSRVFGGAMSNEFGSGSKTEYVTLQAGYDYSLALGDARNYMGIALAYGSSWTKANDGIGATTSSLSNVNSSMVEVGIYNSYVMDSGWYNDTIFKFDYIMSDFTLTAGSNTSDNSTNNFAIILSDEFGYRYKFGGDKSWYIDPQVEVGFGYFNQSDFNHALNATTTMTATQDTILTLRTRAGASLGKKFTAQKGFASVYVGAFYEYDYINGGDAETTLSGGLVGNQLNNLKSNGRAIVNIGSNIELSEGVRMYIDVEKSFGNKQRVDMQFNFGARYSFGERATTISYKEQNSNRIPLKIQNQ